MTQPARTDQNAPGRPGTTVVTGLMLFALFAAVTTPPITQDLPGTAVFAAFGAALPFGWRATRLRNTSLTLPLLVWPIAIVLRAWFSIIIGIPALVFYLVRNLWWLHRIGRA